MAKENKSGWHNPINFLHLKSKPKDDLQLAQEETRREIIDKKNKEKKR